jgi:hypothetical protein
MKWMFILTIHCCVDILSIEDIDQNILKLYKEHAEQINSVFYDETFRRFAHKYTRVIEQMDHIFKTAPLTGGSITLFRGIHNELCGGNNDDYEFKDTLMKSMGKDICFNIFLSTSYDPSVAKTFSSGLMLKLLIPANIPYIPIDVWLKHDETDTEHEIILGRNLLFNINRVDYVFSDSSKSQCTLITCICIGMKV